MSEPLRFSAQLVQDLGALLQQHDPSAEDPLIAAQYMAATMGFLLGHDSMPMQQKGEYLEELYKFAVHVIHDVEGHQQSAPPEPDVGVWRPE